MGLRFGSASAALREVLKQRFDSSVAVESGVEGVETLLGLAGHRSCRAYADKPVTLEFIRMLCAVALSAPTKSDLQQADIVILEDAEARRKVTSLLGEEWISSAPAFLVFCGNNRRQRLIHERRKLPFVNDHLDAFFNASVDAAIVLATFVAAAEAAGLGCCPISAVRNRAQDVSDLLGLPDHVFPLAGMTVGWPEVSGDIAYRLPLEATLHTDRYGEERLEEHLDAYDRRREQDQPYAQQRFVEDYGGASSYPWSEDKARQYSKPERENFGAFVRRKGFKLD